MDKVVVGRQQRESVTDAQLREQGIDGTYLHTGTAAAISQFSSVDVILPVRGEERQGREPADDVVARTWAGKPLQQFLQDQPRGDDGFVAFKGVAQREHFRGGGNLIATEGERPDAGIDEQRHLRERSAL